MLQRLKRLNKLWKLSKDVNSKVNVAPEGIELGKLKEMLDVDLGDGKAEFLGEGSEEEFKDQQNEDKGYKGIFGIGK